MLSLSGDSRAAENPAAVNRARSHTFATYTGRKLQYYSSSNRSFAAR